MSWAEVGLVAAVMSASRGHGLKVGHSVSATTRGLECFGSFITILNL
jgi:hypothetical protein